MADYVFNISKGRGVELYNRAKGNDPAASALIAIPLSAQGSEAEAQDYDDVTAVLGGTSDEQVGGGWVRKTWTGPAPASNTTGLLIVYDADTGAGGDGNLLPLTSHTFTVTADGNDVVLNAGVFLRAS